MDRAITVNELIEILRTWPPDTEIWYKDENFGGKSEPLTKRDVTLETNIALIRSPYWDEVD